MKEHHNINEAQLDDLLKELYLEENSQAVNEVEAEFVLLREYNVAIDPSKEKDLLTKLNNDIKDDKGFKWFNIGSIIIGGIFLLFYILYSSETPEEVRKQQINEYKEKHQDKNKILNEYRAESKGPVVQKLNDTFGKEKFIPQVMYDDTTKHVIPNENKKDVEVDRSIVPLLTEKDRSRYQNIKDQILRRILKMDKGLYTHVPSYKLNYKGKNTVLDGFFVRNVCITNLEYKAFLADLISQKRSEDYLKGQIQTENWIKAGYTVLANSYFQDERYNDFPVVNVTKKGAELFCKWLEEELKLYVLKSKLKFPELIIRLPRDDEAIFAAREGYAKISFEEGYNTIYDESEGFVDHTFTKRAELSKKRVKRIDSLYTTFTTNKYGWKENEILEFYSKGFNYYRNIPGDSIFSDRMKVLTKVGRVSEIVVQKNTGNIWLSGQTWKNKAEYLKLDSEFKTYGSSPFVGFRVVLIDPNDPEYKNPFW